MWPIFTVTAIRRLARLTLTVLVLLLTSCSSVRLLAGPTPTPDLMELDGEFVGAIRLREPVTVKATFRTRDAVSRLEIVAFSSEPTTVVEPPDTCWIDTQAGIPASCTFTVRFQDEGLHTVVLQGVSRVTGRKYAPLDVQVTRSGATISPPSTGPRANIEKLDVTPARER